MTSLSGVSMHNRPYRSSSSGASHDRRILDAERYDHGSRGTHRRGVAGCSDSRPCCRARITGQTERNLRGRSISSGVRFLIQDQLNPCLPPAKVRCIRSASVFAEHTRTNHASCAAEAVPIWVSIIGTIKNATINARIDPSILAESPSRPSPGSSLAR